MAIQRLDPSTVNRIAAGEIIVGPSNALKELIENSIDAQATSIHISVSDGGLKQLQITDNGTGINYDDLPLVCERYATSKITQFSDLDSVSTYGFRGEALASISHVAHVTIVTKQKEVPTSTNQQESSGSRSSSSSSGWKAQYFNGQLTSAVSPIAVAQPGTQITVQDLFFNVRTRLKALKSKSEEYAKILDVAGRYAVHWNELSFAVEEDSGSGGGRGRGRGQAKTLNVSRESTRERISHVFGPDVAKNLLSFSVPANNEIGLVSCQGQISNANYSSKRAIPPLIFVNHRLVENERLRRALRQVYSVFLPKGEYFFAYVALEMDPANLDVNIHPTKRQVKFLYEDEIIDEICRKVQEALAEVDVSRSYKVQTVVPVTTIGTSTKSSSAAIATRTPSSKNATIFGSAGSAAKRLYEHQLDRTDAKQPKISSLFASQAAMSQVSDDFSVPSEVEVNLESVYQLKEAIRHSADSALTTMFSGLVFVGVLSYERRLMAVQYGVRLYLVDYGAVCKELFYQLAVSGFANFGRIEVERLDVRRLLEAAASTRASGEDGADNGQTMEEDTEAAGDGADNDQADSLKDLDSFLEVFANFKEMLDEYFSISVDCEEDGLYLTSLPLLLKGYIPPMHKLPDFFHALRSVDWTDERNCFQGIISALANFYIPDTGPVDFDEPENVKSRELLTAILIPEIKQRLIGSKWLKQYVTEIANLPGLYRVFERC